MRIHPIPVPTPFYVGDVNAYLLEGPPLTLVDTGPLTDEAWDALEAGVRAAGFPVEAVERLVLTHPHHDHSGLARRVRRASGCPVYAHPVDHDRLLDRPGEWDAIAGFLGETCRRAGAPPWAADAVLAGLEALNRYTEPLDAVHPLDEGAVVTVGGTRLRVLHTPGHARGALCLWDGGTGSLVAGDTLLPTISSNAILEPGRDGRFRERTLVSYLATLERLRALAPRRLLPGHGEVLGGAETLDRLVAGRLSFHAARADEILGLVRSGARTPWEISEHLFPDPDPAFLFLVVSEVVGHLDLLADRGAVTFGGQDGPWIVIPAGEV